MKNCLMCLEPLVDEFTVGDVSNGHKQHVDKARAEEFIHVFVNNGQKLTEFLEQMVKVSTAS